MAPRRCVRSVKVINNNNYNNLSLNDVLCPICRSIFIEPVTLPCSHGFCLPCFEGTLANANLTCPLCRIRFGSWHRLAKKEQKIINIQFWDAIKLTFPREVKNRLNGIEEQLEEHAPIRLTSPGSIRREYEIEKSKEEKKLVKQREIEIKANEEYIRKLKAEEEKEIAEREKKLKFDEQVAKEIAKEINYIDDEERASNSKINSVHSKKAMDKCVNDKKQCMFVYKIQNNKRNQIVCPDKQGIINSLLKTSNQAEVVVNVCDKGDCINRNLMLFKPIEQVNVPVKKIVSPIKVPTKTNKVSTVIIRPPNGKILFMHNRLISAFASFMDNAPIKSQGRKRKLSNANNKLNRDIMNVKKEGAFYTPQKRPTIHDTRQTSKITLHCNIREESTSPPFFGFDNNKTINTRTNNVRNITKIQLRTSKELQEESDFAFAKQLQEELNRNSRYCTRNSILQKNLTRRKRQITLDEFMNSPKPAIT